MLAEEGLAEGVYWLDDRTEERKSPIMYSAKVLQELNCQESQKLPRVTNTHVGKLSLTLSKSTLRRGSAEILVIEAIKRR